MKPFKIDLTKCTPIAKSLMVGRGAPAHILLLNRTLDEDSLLPSLHEKRQPTTPTTQLKNFLNCWENPTNSWTLIIGSDADEQAAQVVALGLMWQSIILHAKNSATHPRPLYWPIYGGTYDKLRDREDFRAGIGDVGLLILTNLAENSGSEKIEKCRDLLNMYSGIPRVVTIAGCDPLIFALDRLHVSPNFVLHLGLRNKVRQI
jgi:hypothetical protein